MAGLVTSGLNTVSFVRGLVMSTGEIVGVYASARLIGGSCGGNPSGLMIWGALGSGLKVMDPFKLLLVGTPLGMVVISNALTLTLALGFADCTNTERAMLEKRGIVTSSCVMVPPVCWKVACPCGSGL